MAPPSRSYQPEELIPGTVYRVMRLIGAGGMGTVYDVEDTTIGKRYVLKTLHPQLGDRQDLARRLQNEARTIARLNHPNIVEVVTAGMTGDDLRLPYYVMERLNGQSLRFVLEKKGRLELQHAYHIMIDLLDALDHAHDKGVVHRDVKPDNIFLHRSMSGVTVTKLLDFGIVSLLDGGTVADTRGHFLGTLRYAAPEQLSGDKPSPRVDVYAAGLVLFEMVTGAGPFDDEEGNQRLIAAHMNRVPPLLSRFAAVPPQLDSLVRSALEKDPAKRPRDAFSFAASLRNLRRTSTPSPPEVANQSTVPPVALPQLAIAKTPIAPATEILRKDVKTPGARSPYRGQTQTLIGMTPSAGIPPVAPLPDPGSTVATSRPGDVAPVTKAPPGVRPSGIPTPHAPPSYLNESTNEGGRAANAYVPTASLRVPFTEPGRNASVRGASPPIPSAAKAVTPVRRSFGELLPTAVSPSSDNRSQSGQSHTVPSSSDIAVERVSRAGVFAVVSAVAVAAGVFGFVAVRQMGQKHAPADAHALPTEIAAVPESKSAAAASPSADAEKPTESTVAPVAAAVQVAPAPVASSLPKRPASKSGSTGARPSVKAVSAPGPAAHPVSEKPGPGF